APKGILASLEPRKGFVGPSSNAPANSNVCTAGAADAWSGFELAMASLLPGPRLPVYRELKGLLNKLTHRMPVPNRRIIARCFKSDSHRLREKGGRRRYDSHGAMLHPACCVNDKFGDYKSVSAGSEERRGKAQLQQPGSV